MVALITDNVLINLKESTMEISHIGKDISNQILFNHEYQVTLNQSKIKII